MGISASEENHRQHQLLLNYYFIFFGAVFSIPSVITPAWRSIMEHYVSGTLNGCIIGLPSIPRIMSE
jgi:hypothetical protein